MKLGIIADNLNCAGLLENHEEREVNTPYGMPSSKILCGVINGVSVFLLARHGRNYEIPPSQINYRANIYALKMFGCTHIIATDSVGSLKEWIKPGDLVFPDQFIDFTRKRESTFHDRHGVVVHTEMAEPFSEDLRQVLNNSADLLGLSNHYESTIVVIEGPRYSTKAESMFFQNHADIIGMTTVPECILAKELGIKYANVSVIMDYDCWKLAESDEETVVERLQENSENVKKLLLQVISYFSDSIEKENIEGQNIRGSLT
jgi:5'-methylthioadenosine phosphorylase